MIDFEARRIYQISNLIFCLFTLLLVCVQFAVTFAKEGSDSSSIRCFSCTTLNADRLLSDVQDLNWRRWLENVRYVSRTVKCNDHFDRTEAMENGVRTQECMDGVCLKMWFREKHGNEQVWRTCIPNSINHIRPDCTRITSSQGEMEVCTCDENLCNAGAKSSSRNVIFFMIILFIYCSFYVS